MNAPMQTSRTEDEDPYQGREHARAKHEILKTYLERLLMIVGQHFNKVAFVDCFAGPWGAKSDDLTHTSPGIAMRTMKQCRDSLAARRRHVRMRAIFVEIEPANCETLAEFLTKESQSQVQGEVICDSFQNAVPLILGKLDADEFAFVFVDPFAWKEVIAPATLAPLLMRPKTELLINFMSTFIRLATGHQNQEQNLISLFGQNSRGLTEQQRVDLYRQRLQESGSSTRLSRVRTAALPIEYGDKDAVFYYMVYATRNARGLLTFLEEAEKADKGQRERRHERRSGGQQDLFGSLGLPVQAPDPDLAASAWLNAFPELGVPVEFTVDKMADIAEAASCDLSELYRVGRQLVESGHIQNLDAKDKRPKKPVHWHKNERMVRLK